MAAVSTLRRNDLSPDLRQLLDRMSIRTPLASSSGVAAFGRAGEHLQARSEWTSDEGLFTLWTRGNARSGVEQVLDFPVKGNDAIDDALERMRRVQEPVEPPFEAQPLSEPVPWSQPRVTENVLLPSWDRPLAVFAQSAPSEPDRRHERAEQMHPRQGASYVGPVQPQPLPALAGTGSARRPPLTGRQMRRRMTGPSRYFPAPPKRGRPWSKTAILGTILTAAGVAVLWAVLGLPVPSSNPPRSSTPPKPVTSSVISSESTSPSAAASSAPASAPARSASTSASAAPAQSASTPASTAPAPSAPTYNTKNGPRTLDQIRAELRASGYPFSNSTDAKDLVAAYQATTQGVPAPLPAVFASDAPAGSQPGAVPASWQDPAPNGGWSARTSDQIAADFVYTAGGPGHEAEAQASWNRQHSGEVQAHGF